MKIILGSQSKNRKRVLEEMGFDFDVMSADIDEKAIRCDSAEELTLALANAKANVILQKVKKDAIVITSDQVVRWNGAIREKPENEKEAREFLKTAADYPAETVTAVVAANTATGARQSGVDVAKVYFKKMPEKAIEKLILEKNVFSWAGGFCIDEPLIKDYVEKIEGERESVLGLPKRLTLELLNNSPYAIKASLVPP